MSPSKSRSSWWRRYRIELVVAVVGALVVIGLFGLARYLDPLTKAPIAVEVDPFKDSPTVYVTLCDPGGRCQTFHPVRRWHITPQRILIFEHPHDASVVVGTTFQFYFNTEPKPKEATPQQRPDPRDRIGPKKNPTIKAEKP